MICLTTGPIGPSPARGRGGGKEGGREGGRERGREGGREEREGKGMERERQRGGREGGGREGRERERERQRVGGDVHTCKHMGESVRWH